MKNKLICFSDLKAGELFAFAYMPEELLIKETSLSFRRDVDNFLEMCTEQDFNTYCVRKERTLF